MTAFQIAFAATVVGGLALAALKWAGSQVPRAGKKLMVALRGSVMCVMGPKRVGKTSFLNYLQFGRLPDQRPVGGPTRHVSDPFSVTVEEDSRLKLHIRRTRDFPGELDPGPQVKWVKEESPSILLLFLAFPTVDLDWLEEFLGRLADLLRTDHGFGKTLRACRVVINKDDLVTESEAATAVASVRALVEAVLGPVVSPSGLSRIEVSPCSLLGSEGGKLNADALILSVANDLSASQPLKYLEKPDA